MPIHFANEPGFFENITPEHLQATRAIAQEFGIDLGSIVMSEDPTDGDAPAVMILRLPPGGRIDRHEHGCHRVEIVLHGSLQTADGQTLQPGDLAVTPPGSFYGPFIAGPQGSVTVEIFGKASGLTNIRYDEQDPESAARGAQILERLRSAEAAPHG